jgi:sugar phosphate isomerase/epimerase
VVAPVSRYAPGAGTRTLWWGTVADTDVPTLASAAAAAGFDAVAVTPGMHQEVADRIAEVRDTLRAEGIRVQLIDPLVSALPGSPTPADVPEHLRKHFVHTADDAFRAAEAFGGADVCVGGFLGAPVTYAEVRDAVAALAARARRHGARVLVEFMPRTQIPNLATAVALVEEIAAPNLGLVFDTWHFTRIGGMTADIRALPPGIVTSIQVADRDSGADHRPYVPMAGRTLPGDGALPLCEWLAALLENSPHADVGAEVFSDDLRARPVAAAAAAAGTALRSVLSWASCRA